MAPSGSREQEISSYVDTRREPACLHAEDSFAEGLGAELDSWSLSMRYRRRSIKRTGLGPHLGKQKPMPVAAREESPLTKTEKLPFRFRGAATLEATYANSKSGQV